MREASRRRDAAEPNAGGPGVLKRPTVTRVARSACSPSSSLRIAGPLAPMKLGVTDGLHLRPGLVQPALSLTGQGLIDDGSPFEGLVD